VSSLDLNVLSLWYPSVIFSEAKCFPRGKLVLLRALRGLLTNIKVW
jgi:hypothetical protein